jgi:hypothetical protein
MNITRTLAAAPPSPRSPPRQRWRRLRQLRAADPGSRARTLEPQDVRPPDARDARDRHEGGHSINAPSHAIDSGTICPRSGPFATPAALDEPALAQHPRAVHALAEPLAAPIGRGSESVVGGVRSGHKASTTSVVGCETAERRSLRSGRLSAGLSPV